MYVTFQDLGAGMMGFRFWAVLTEPASDVSPCVLHLWKAHSSLLPYCKIQA